MGNGPKPIAVFDIDGTIFRSSLLIEITQAMIKIGAFPPEASTHYRSEYAAWQQRSGHYKDYLDKVVNVFERYIHGVKVEVLEAMSDIVIANLAQETYLYSRDLIEHLKKTHFLVAISGSPAPLVLRFCSVYGFNDFKATEYRVSKGRYNGQASLGLVNKHKTVAQMLKKHRLTLDGSLGVGDTESDVSFLKMVSCPIAFNPNTNLFNEASANRWKIVVERKDKIYELETENNKYYLAERP